MEWLNHVVLLVVVMTGWNQTTSAIGLCEFALKFPLKGNERLEQCIHFGTVGVEYRRDPSAFSSTLKSVFEETTERHSKTELFIGVTQPLLVKSTVNKQNPSIALTGEFTTSITPSCAANMVYSMCSGICERTCQQPNVCKRECDGHSDFKCLCPSGFFIKGDFCVTMETCGCFIQEEGIVLAENRDYISDNCSTICTCRNDELSCNSYLRCSPHATCKEQNDVRQCYCNEGFEGDGETCSPITSQFKDCNDVYNAGHITDGVYSVSPSTWNESSFDVFCVMETDGGGWTVFQRRVNGSTSFFKTWADYRDGFGDIQHEFWLGNEKLYHILQQGLYEIRVDTVMYVNGSNGNYHHKYDRFEIGDETHKYPVTELGQWSGTLGGAMYMVKGVSFSTYDEDNDGLSYSCAGQHHGGWWYGGVDWHITPQRGGSHCQLWSASSGALGSNILQSCTGSNPNGIYNGDNGYGIFLHHEYCHINYLEMKIRRKELK